MTIKSSLKLLPCNKPNNFNLLIIYNCENAVTHNSILIFSLVQEFIQIHIPLIHKKIHFKPRIKCLSLPFAYRRIEMSIDYVRGSVSAGMILVYEKEGSVYLLLCALCSLYIWVWLYKHSPSIINILLS